MTTAPPLRQMLTGARIFTGEATLDDHALLIEGGRVRDLVPAASAYGGTVTRLAEGWLLAPGLIDIQVNGGGGVLFNNSPTSGGALAIAAAHRRLGATSVLPTVITDTDAVMRAAADAAAEAAARPGSGVRGIHLEGPFLNPERAGVHRPRLIRAIEDHHLDWLCELPSRFGAEARVLLTLAPEQVPPDAIARLAASGIRVSAGHSAATLEQAQAAMAAGVSGFTHLFNAMPPLASRAPGIALAAIAGPEAWCGVIADGIHVHPAMLRLALASKGADRIMLVSDCMATTGSDIDEFRLQGRRILRRHGRLETEDGVLAGADIDLAASVRNAVALLGVEPGTALRMASLNPARFLGLDHCLGRLQPGYHADLVLLDGGLHARASWVGGRTEGEARTR